MISSHFINEWHYWTQILVVPFFILLAAFLIGQIINNFIKKKFLNHINKDTFLSIFANAVQGLPVAWCSGIGLYLSIKSIKLIDSTITLFLSSLLYAVIVLSITRVLSRTVSGLLELKIKRGDENLQATSLLTNIVSFIIYSTGIIIILQYLGISVTPLLTALGVGGMAVALGLQDTLANIFSGLHIILSKQLQIYDFVKLSNGESGQVVDITWRFTKIQTPMNNIIIVPNKDIASTTITNYNMPKEEVSVVITIGVSYDSDLDHVEQVTMDTARLVLDKVEHRIDYDPVIRFFEFADSSINFNIILKTNVFLNQYVIKHEFIKALTKRYRQENIEIPFPIRTIVRSQS